MDVSLEGGADDSAPPGSASGESGHVRGTRPPAVSQAPTAAVWVVTADEVMSACLVAGLNHLGWWAVGTSAARLPPHPAGTPASSLVLVVDDTGRVPDLAVLGGTHQAVLAVGARTDSAWLGATLARGAGLAINAEQPLPALLHDIEEGLATPHRRARRPQLAALREHQREAALFTRLTEREQDVLGCLLLGRTAVEIANERRVSLATVRSQIHAVLTGLGVTSQVAAIAMTHRSCHETRVLRYLEQLHQF